MSIQQSPALFALLGTFYGGNGVNNFALPDLRSRTPLHMGSSIDGGSYTIGQQGGIETVTILTTTLAQHSHAMNATTTTGNQGSAGGGLPATVGQIQSNPTVFIYAAQNTGTTVTLAADTVGLTGGSSAHNNVQPFLVTNFCIALTGIFPSRN